MLYSKDKFFGYELYYTSFDGVEPFHAHVSEKQRERGSAKLWIYEDGDTKIAHKGAVNDRVINAVQDWIKINVDSMKYKWINSFGSINYLDNGKKVIAEVEIKNKK